MKMIHASSNPISWALPSFSPLHPFIHSPVVIAVLLSTPSPTAKGLFIHPFTCPPPPPYSYT
jgi:hypothetical protein